MKRPGQAASYRLSLATALLIGGLGAACAYDEAQSWRECCALKIVGENPSSKERNTLMAWGGTHFHGDGGSQDGEDRKAWRRRQIAYGLTVFQERHHGDQARDYLASLGMTCGAVDARKAEPTRCAAALPVWATCTVLFSWPILSTPVPKELQKPIAALLQMSIDVSGSQILDSSVRVVPFAGGRLCKRQ